MLDILRMSEDQKHTSNNRNAMTQLFRDLLFEQHAGSNHQKPDKRTSNDPGQTMALVTRKKGKGSGEHYGHCNGSMDPGQMGIGRPEGRENEGEKRDHDAMDDARG